MYKTQCVLAFATLCLSLVHSWDIAVSVGDKLEFYSHGMKTDTIHLKDHNLTAITYDEVHNMMLFVDKQSDNDAICGYNLSSKNIRCFVKRSGSNIHDLAFDPATDMLFFTDRKDRSINWISLKNQEFEKNVSLGLFGNLLIKTVDGTPSELEVDSCNGFIYWTNTKQRRRRNYMERARLNGSERYVVDQILPVNTFALDLQTQKNYFFTGLIHNFLNKVDLKGNNIMQQRKMIFYSKLPCAHELTASKDYLYWTQCGASGQVIWQRQKNANISSAKPKVMGRYYTVHTLGIAANYRIKDKVHGRQDCEALARLTPILETEQKTQLDWSTETEQTSSSTAEFDWSTGNTDTTEVGSTAEQDRSTEIEQTSGSTAEFDWSTANTDTTEVGSTAEQDRSTEIEQTSGSAAEFDWSTANTDTTEVGSTAEQDSSTEIEQTSGSTAEFDWSTANTDTIEVGSTAEQDSSTEIEQTSGSTAEFDWSTANTDTTEVGSTAEQDRSTEIEQTSGSTAEFDWSTANTDTTEVGSTAEQDRSTEIEQTSGSTAEFDWSTETKQTSVSTAELDWSIENTETTEVSPTAELDWSELFEALGSKSKAVFLDETGEFDFTTETDQTSETEVGSKCIHNTGYSGSHEVHACYGYCLNNGNCSLNKKREPVCHCRGDYVGDRCEVSGCHNYCIQGSCSLNDEGHPKCRCNAGYSGARCEVYACHGYCLNSGACSLNKKNKPVCQCVGHHEGTRCEAVKKNTFSYIPQIYSPNRNLTLADSVPNWRRPAVKVSVFVEA